MQIITLKRSVAAASAALLLSTGIASAGQDPVDEPMEPAFEVPFETGTGGGSDTSGPAAGSPEAIAATLDAANELATQASAQGVPSMTESQRATALAQVRRIIDTTGGSPELDGLVAAIEAAPAAE